MKIDRKILQLALPAIVSNITVPLLGLSDTAIAGHLGSARFLAAMGVGATMMNLSAWLFGFLRMGTAGLSATALGASDFRSLSRIFCRTILIALTVGLLLIAVRIPLASFLVKVLEAGPSVAPEAELYYRISIFAAPAQLATMAMSGWMVGMQSTFWPMVVAIATNVVNIPLSLLLVFGCGCGFSGLAIGTSVAQWVGFLLALFCSVHIWRRGLKDAGLNVSMSILSELKNVWTVTGSAGFLSVNSALFFRSACVMAVSMGMTAYSASVGESSLAANTVMMQFFTFFSFFMDGFAHAAEALIGRAAGGRKREELRETVRHLLKWSAFVALLFTAIYTFAGRPLAGLLTDSVSVRGVISQMHWALMLLPALSVMAFIFDGFYVGITRTQIMLFATFLSAAIFFLVALWPEGERTLVRLWISFLCYLFMRGSVLAVLFRRQLHNSYSKYNND